MSEIKTGSLYIVSTPIGNLDDISHRALTVLSTVDIIACEDTRHTGSLLVRFGIKKKLVSYHNFNESARTSRIIDTLIEGSDVALVSDAGTPGISDPAYRLVRAAIENDISVFPIPGASSVLAALVVSGCPLDRFVFEGFLPPKGSKRHKAIASLHNEPRTIVFLESPFRIITLIEEIHSILGDRYVSVSREMTKLHEETVRGTASEVLSFLRDKKPRGEYTVVVHGFEDIK